MLEWPSGRLSKPQAGLWAGGAAHVYSATAEVLKHHLEMVKNIFFNVSDFTGYSMWSSSVQAECAFMDNKKTFACLVCVRIVASYAGLKFTWSKFLLKVCFFFISNAALFDHVKLLLPCNLLAIFTLRLFSGLVSRTLSLCSPGTKTILRTEVYYLFFLLNSFRK